MYLFTAWCCKYQCSEGDWSSRTGSKAIHPLGTGKVLTCYAMALRQLQTSISSPFRPLQIQLVPDTGAKRGHFSWVTAPRPWGTSSCADLKHAALQCGSFVWNPAQPPIRAPPPWGTGAVVELHPLTFTAQTVSEMLWEDCPSGGEKRRLLQGQ